MWLGKAVRRQGGKTSPGARRIYFRGFLSPMKPKQRGTEVGRCGYMAVYALYSNSYALREPEGQLGPGESCHICELAHLLY